MRSGTCTFEDAVTVYVYGENSFPKNFSSYDLSETSITGYRGSVNQYVDGVSYGYLYLYNSTKTLSGAPEVKGILNIYTGNLDVSENNYSLTVGVEVVVLLWSWWCCCVSSGVGVAMVMLVWQCLQW